MVDVSCTAFGLNAIYRNGHVHHTVRRASRLFPGHLVAELLPCLGCGEDELTAADWCPTPLEWF